MGIQGLLPLLKSIHKATHLRKFAGQTLGVDAYGWLHRGTISCAIELAEGTPTRKHIEFALNRVRMLIHFGVKPYLVFDGDYLPSKAHTEKERAARRKDSKKAGLELLRTGRRSQAYLELQKAIDVTPAMARELIEELKRLDVPYVVAPYEADSQLAYLEKQGHISGVISEDSDLLVFGVQCLLTKLDQYGECVMIKRNDFTACREVSLVGWSDKEFRMMAMLSGCDYLPGIEKMGLKTAYRLVRKHKAVDRVIRSVQFDGKMKVPAGYLERFSDAERTFLHQWVFCSEARCLLHLNPLPAELDAASMPYIGKSVDPKTAAGVASGQLDPNTKLPIVVPSRFQQRAILSRTVIQTPNEKQGKPITEFFAARRTPLGELDPNSLTPSPSQQVLLQAHTNRSWSASQAPSVGLVGIVSASGARGPPSAPQAARRTFTEPSPAARSLPPKRQRLCSESSIAAAMHGAGTSNVASSRFFGTTAAQPSPSLRKKSPRSKYEEFDLWSDDAAAEAVAAATATPELTQKDDVSLPRKRKKLIVFADSPATQEEPEYSEESQLTASTSHSQLVTEADTPDTSFESPASQSQGNVFTKGVNATFAALKSKAYVATPLKITPRTKSAPAFSVYAHVSAPLSVAKQSIPSRRQDSVLVPESSPIAACIDDAPKEGPADEADDDINDEEWLQMEQQSVGGRPTGKLQGSEDLLVPESPDRSEEDGSARSSLDLGRFAFAG